VDIFDALTTPRPYRLALSPAQALTELREEVRRGWRRADLVEILDDLVRRGLIPGPPTPLGTAPGGPPR
jgi:putative two-component system response regulator